MIKVNYFWLYQIFVSPSNRSLVNFSIKINHIENTRMLAIANKDASKLLNRSTNSKACYEYISDDLPEYKEINKSVDRINLNQRQ